MKDHPNRMRLKQGDMLALWRLAHQDKLDNGKRVTKFLFGTPYQPRWDAEPNLRMFACVGSGNFFKYLIHSLVFQQGLLSFGRCEMYMALAPPIFIVRSFFFFAVLDKNACFFSSAFDVQQRSRLHVVSFDVDSVPDYVYARVYYADTEKSFFAPSSQI